MTRSHWILLGCLVTTGTASADEPGFKKTIDYVKKLQAKNGGFRSHDPKPDAVKIEPTLRATTSAVRALHYFGADLPHKEACVKFVASCHDAESGGFCDKPLGKPDVFSTAVGLMAVVELKMPVERYAKVASQYLSNNAKTFEEIRIAAAGFEAIKKKTPQKGQWTAAVLHLQNKDASFGKERGIARDTASSVVTLLRLGAVPANTALCLQVLKAGQRQNGGWGTAESEIASDLDSTYRVMRCFVMLKTQPANVEGVRSFVAKCRNPDGGYGIAPGQPSSASGTYFAAIITHWLKKSK